MSLVKRQHGTEASGPLAGHVRKGRRDPPASWGQGKHAHLLVGALPHSGAWRGVGGGVVPRNQSGRAAVDLVHVAAGERVLDNCLSALASLGCAELRVGKVHYGFARELALARIAGAESRQGRYAEGGVAVGSLSALRSIPFRAVFMLGLGESSFPERERRDPLDLRLVRRRAGDVSNGERDRYLFLETLLAARERRHEAGALLVAAEAEQRQRDRARVHRDGDADARVAARERLEHEDVGEEVGAGAGVLLRDADAHEPELGELREHLAREAMLPVPGGRVRLDLLAGELPREPPDLPLLGGQIEIHPLGRTPPARPWPRTPSPGVAGDAGSEARRR